MSVPYILDGEDVERLYFTFCDQLRRLGDERFVAALSAERPDVVAAVAGFIDFGSLDGDFARHAAFAAAHPRSISRQRRSLKTTASANDT